MKLTTPEEKASVLSHHSDLSAKPAPVPDREPYCVLFQQLVAKRVSPDLLCLAMALHDALEGNKP